MRIIMSVVLAFIAMLAPAQEVKMKPLAPIEVEVSYELDQLCDYSQQVGESDWREKSTLLLEIGKGMVHSYVVEEHHKLIDQFVMQRSKNRWRVTLFNVHALVGETFMAYPKVGELTQVVNLDAAGVFQYVEDIPDFKWKILSKSKVIMGYNCQCATTTFRGRDYEAWFTADIPLSCGPWKFHGLPGLILEVADVKNEFHFTVNGISQIKGGKNIEMFDEKIRSIKRSRALKMETLLHKNHGAYAADYGINYRLGDGMENEEQPYYPIELE